MWRQALRVASILVAGICLSATQLAAQQWKDPSPHLVRKILVQAGVVLEVLDWGGSGDVIVFSHGLRDTAHAFDDFAPLFTDSFRVIAITRRGFGASSHPDTGFDAPTRARDIRVVLDSLHIDRVILIGHSLGGEEITRFAVNYPDRVRALVYLDSYTTDSIPGLPPEPPFTPQVTTPQMTSEDSASVHGVMTYVARRFGFTANEAQVRALSEFGPDGHLKVLFTPDATAALSAAMETANYAAVHAPAFGIFRTTPTFEVPSYLTLDAAKREMLEAHYKWYRAWELAQIQWFRTKLVGSQVLEIPGANHYVFVSHRDEVQKAIRAFLSHL